MHFTVNWLFQLACLKIKDLNKSVHFIETNLGNFKLYTHQDSKVLIVSTSLILIFASPSVQVFELENYTYLFTHYKCIASSLTM